MRSDIAPGGTFPDYEPPDQDRVTRRRNEAHWARSGKYVTGVSAIDPFGLEHTNPNDDPQAT